MNHTCSYRRGRSFGYGNTSSFSNTGKEATIQQLTTMLAASKNILFSGRDHLLTTGTDDQTLYYRLRWRLGNNQKCQVISTGGLAGGYNLEIGQF